MGKAVIGVIALVVGIVLGTLFGGALIGGSAAGVGLATGLSAGICSTVRATQEDGLLTAEEVDQALNRAAADLAEMVDAETPAVIVGSSRECAAIMDQLRAASGE